MSGSSVVVTCLVHVPLLQAANDDTVLVKENLVGDQGGAFVHMRQISYMIEHTQRTVIIVMFIL